MNLDDITTCTGIGRDPYPAAWCKRPAAIPPAYREADRM